MMFVETNVADVAYCVTFKGTRVIYILAVEMKSNSGSKFANKKTLKHLFFTFCSIPSFS